MPYNVEPSVAHAVLARMVAAEAPRLSLHFAAEVASVTKASTKAGPVITSLTTTDGRNFTGKVFVDASYEGDLLARAGVDFTIGREPSSLYNESLNGRGTGSARNQNDFAAAVDPTAAGGKGALLPGLLSTADAARVSGRPGDGDTQVQAYNFRLCVTNDPGNRVPYPKPDEYHPEASFSPPCCADALGTSAPSGHQSQT